MSVVKTQESRAGVMGERGAIGARIDEGQTAEVGVGEKLLRVEEFLEICRRPEYEEKQLELDEGRLIVMPLPGGTHGAIAWWISVLLGQYVLRVGRGLAVSHDTALVLGRDPDTVRGADIAFYRDKTSFDGLPTGAMEEMPELVVEVLSPWDKPNAVLRKVQQYLRAGVQMVWVVDAEDKTVAVYRAGREPQVLVEKDELSGEEVLPGFSCRVADLFRLPATSQQRTGVSA